MALCCILAVALCSSTALLGSQSGPESRPRFDVVSIKPNHSEATGLSLDISPSGRMVALNIPLKQFIRAAYTLQLHQITGTPSWVDAERFDITAVSEAGFKGPVIWMPGQYAPVQLMMQSILADRFKMAARLTDREEQGYALVVRSPGSTAGKLIAGTTPCPPDCGVQNGPGTIAARNVPLPQVAELLSQKTGRLVIDDTGLTGRFTFDLRWTPEADQSVTDSPSLATALQEQLGLRLEPRRVRIPVLAVDRIERPDPD